MPPIISTVQTLGLVHQALREAEEHPNKEEVSRLARVVLSIVAFNLRHPMAKISNEQAKLVDKLKELLHTC